MSKILITALATPFDNGKIDCRAYEKLVALQTENGADALLVASTTAEGPLLEVCEKKLLFTLTKAVAENIPLIAGVSGFSATQAVKEATFFADLGADALLIAPPSFTKCTTEGYKLYVEEILRAVKIPVILYNVPARCGYRLDEEVIGKLREEGVAAIKDAGSDLDYTERVAKKMPSLCGNDELLPEALAAGAEGVISVVSNAAPELTRGVLEGRGEYFEDFKRLAKWSTLEVNPVCIKYMLYKKGIFSNFEMRLPLTAARKDTQKIIDGGMK